MILKIRLNKRRLSKSGNKMRRVALLPVIGLLTILPGCYSSNLLEYEGLKPANIAISGSVKSLVVVSKCDLDSAYKFTAILAGRLSDFKRDSIMMKQTVLGCSDALLESPRFSLFNPVVTRNLAGQYTNPSEKIPWTKVLEIAGDPPHDAVLSMEYGTIDDTIRSNPASGWLNPCQFVVSVKTHWRLYRLSDFQTVEFNFADTVAYDIDSPSEFLSSLNMGPDFIKKTTMISVTARPRCIKATICRSR